MVGSSGHGAGAEGEAGWVLVAKEEGNQAARNYCWEAQEIGESCFLEICFPPKSPGGRQGHAGMTCALPLDWNA